jgi:hypothetical protein
VEDEACHGAKGWRRVRRVRCLPGSTSKYLDWGDGELPPADHEDVLKYGPIRYKQRDYKWPADSPGIG